MENEYEFGLSYFVDKVDPNQRGLFSLNLLLAEFILYEDQSDIDVIELYQSRKNINPISSIYKSNNISTVIYHKYISRIYDVGPALNARDDIENE